MYTAIEVETELVDAIYFLYPDDEAEVITEAFFIAMESQGKSCENYAERINNGNFQISNIIDYGIDWGRATENYRDLTGQDFPYRWTDINRNVFNYFAEDIPTAQPGFFAEPVTPKLKVYKYSKHFPLMPQEPHIHHSGLY